MALGGWRCIRPSLCLHLQFHPGGCSARGAGILFKGPGPEKLEEGPAGAGSSIGPVVGCTSPVSQQGQQQWHLMTSTKLRAPKRCCRCTSTSNSQEEGLLWPLTLRPCTKGNAGKCSSSSAPLLLPIHPRAPHCAATGSSFKSSVEWASITIIIDTSIHPPFFLKITP